MAQINDKINEEFSITIGQLLDGIMLAHNDIDELIKISAEDFLRWTSHVKAFHKFINALAHDSNKSLLNDNLSLMVKDLQFHDIISQKLRHIQSVFSTLKTEFKQLLNGDITMDKALYVYAFPDILLLDRALFDFIIKEYKTSTENLKQELSNLWKEEKIRDLLKSETLVMSRKSEFYTLAVQLSNCLANLNTLAAPMLLEGKNIPRRDRVLDKVKKGFTMRSERMIYNRVFKKGNDENETVDIDLF